MWIYVTHDNLLPPWALITVLQAAKVLGKTRSVVHRLIAKKQIKSQVIQEGSRDCWVLVNAKDVFDLKRKWEYEERPD